MRPLRLDYGIIYYTDNRVDGEPFIPICRRTVEASGLPIVSVSLRPIDFGWNIVLDGRVRSYPTMVDQIIAGLENSDREFVFFCEHDVLYHPSHFEARPLLPDIWCYNLNNWRWDYYSDRIVHYDGLTSLSQLCVGRTYALAHYRKRQEAVREWGLDPTRSREPRMGRIWGYEPGTKRKSNGGFSDEKCQRWWSSGPNIDIRHGHTFSKPKTRLEDFKHQPEGWEERTIGDIPEWDLRGMFGR